VQRSTARSSREVRTQLQTSGTEALAGAATGIRLVVSAELPSLTTDNAIVVSAGLGGAYVVLAIAALATGGSRDEEKQTKMLQ